MGLCVDFISTTVKLEVRRCAYFPALWHFFEDIDSNWSTFLIVDLDCDLCIEEIVEDLCRIRKDFPRIGVIVAFRRFHSMADETHRHPICYSSIRVPFGYLELQEEMSVARANCLVHVSLC